MVLYLDIVIICLLLFTEIVTLRQIWQTVKKYLEELFYIVYNFLRSLDCKDYLNAAKLLYKNRKSKVQLTLAIVEFITEKLDRRVLSLSFS